RALGDGASGWPRRARTFRLSVSDGPRRQAAQHHPAGHIRPRHRRAVAQICGRPAPRKGAFMTKFVVRAAGALALLSLSGAAWAGDVNVQDGVAIKGYDPVAYF